MASRKPPYDHRSDDIEINAGRPTVTLRVTNTGDRPVQVGSHFHFFEVNRVMRFERERGWGMHLDIPAGTGVRFEPGETREVTLTAYAGTRHLVGFNGLVDGGLDAPRTKAEALALLADLGFEDGVPDGRTARSGSSGSGSASAASSSGTSSRSAARKPARPPAAKKSATRKAATRKAATRKSAAKKSKSLTKSKKGTS